MGRTKNRTRSETRGTGRGGEERGEGILRFLFPLHRHVSNRGTRHSRKPRRTGDSVAVRAAVGALPARSGLRLGRPVATRVGANPLPAPPRR